MKGKVNNLILKYETERLKLKNQGAPTPSVQNRLNVVNEVLSVLGHLKG